MDATWPGSLVGSFVALGLWSAFFVGAGHCLLVVALVVIVRWLGLFAVVGVE